VAAVQGRQHHHGAREGMQKAIVRRILVKGRTKMNQTARKMMTNLMTTPKVMMTLTMRRRMITLTVIRNRAVVMNRVMMKAKKKRMH
jgi:hypothetical protein